MILCFWPILYRLVRVPVKDRKLFPAIGLFNRGQCLETKLCKLNLTGAVSFLASMNYKLKANFAKKI